MTTTLPHARPTFPGHPTVRRGGFSFVEILFAVIILGLGFIMLAAIFPVGIAQQQLTIDNSVAMALSRSGAATIRSVDSQAATALPISAVVPTPVESIPPSVWPLYSGGFVCPSDPRYAYSFVYSKGTATSVDAFIFTLRSRNSETFTASSAVRAPSGLNYYPADIEPQLVRASVKYDGLGGKIVLTTSGATAGPTVAHPNALTAAVAGAYVILRGLDSGTPITDFTGQIYQLGENDTGNTWYLVPGFGTVSSDMNDQNAVYEAFLLGRGYDPQSISTPPAFAGPSQVISCSKQTITVP
jgi:type II secretory pathway pseudopilin PulG